MLELSELETKILLKCSEQLLKKSIISGRYYKYSKQERARAINKLLDYHLITAVAKPKPGIRKTPIFYAITEKGKDWVQNYLNSYPKN